MGVHAIGRLLDDDALRSVDDLVGDLLSASGGQAVHEQGILIGVRHQAGVYLVIGEIAAADFLLAFLAHARPNVGIYGRRTAHGFGRIGGYAQLEVGCRLPQSLQLMVVDYNESAIRLYEKLGFHLEGTFRQFGLRDGRRYDQHLYGLLREEWK